MKNELLLIALCLVGIFILGKGITGYAISESCCFPPDCEPENVCNSKEAHSPQNDLYNMFIGGILVFVAVTYLILHKTKNI